MDGKLELIKKEGWVGERVKMARGGERDNDEKSDFPGKIGRKVSLVMASGFVLVLLVGGVTILLAKSILESTDEIRRQSEAIKDIDRIHFTAHHLVDASSYAVIRGTPYPGEDFQEITSNLGSQVEAYLKAKPKGDLTEVELGIFREIRDMASTLGRLSQGIFGSVVRGAKAGPEDLETLMGLIYRIHAKAEQITEIHQAKIQRLIQRSGEKMRLILTLYLAFVVIGTLLIAMGSVAFARTIVSPLQTLAAATEEVAGGYFEKRVPVSSKDEIGRLSHSFNFMAERLAEHEGQLRTLNERLERKARESEAIAIENARLYEKTQSLAILEERERIAREMHDGLAQALGSLHFQISRAQELLKGDDTAEARAALEEIRKMAESAYEDVRQSIFGLRVMVSRGLGLVPTLTEYLHEWSVQSGVAADLQIRDEGVTKLSPEAELQLIRIIQEALANVRKHAAARYTRVRFELEGDHVLVTVADDGKGFDPEELPRRTSKCFGLETMRERAESLGGSLEVQSQPGRGTSVLARLPFPGERRS